MWFCQSLKYSGKKRNTKKQGNGKNLFYQRMERSLALEANIGDTWAYYWKFILTQEGQAQADIVK